MEHPSFGADDEDEPNLIFPAAPVPPHERAWRHPSEIGAAMSLDLSDHRPVSGVGRGLLVAAGLVGITVSIVMLQLLRPEPPSVTAGPATSASPLRSSVTTARVTAVRAETTVAAALTTTLSPPTAAPATVMAPTTASTATTTRAPSATSATTPTSAVLPAVATMTIVDLDRVAVPIGSGEYAVTLGDGLGLNQVVTLDTGGGSRQLAVVVATGSDLAVLALPGSTAGAATGSLPPAGGMLAVATSDGDELLSGEPTPEGGLFVRTHGVARTGCPIRTPDGAIAALGRPAPDGTLSLVPVSAAGELIARATTMGGWLGVTGRTAAGLGATVDTVQPGSPAEAAGIRPGDVIVAVDAQPVGSMAELVVLLRTYAPGGAATLTVHRDEGDTEMTVQLVARPAAMDAPPATGPGDQAPVSGAGDAPPPSEP